MRLGDLPEGYEYLAVLGHPIKHSLSPVMHQAALDEMAESCGSFANWRYLRVDVPVKVLGEALQVLKETLSGLIPVHKVEALKYVSARGDLVEAIGAMNTLVFDQGIADFGGNNTDGYGMEMAILRGLDCKLNAQPAIILRLVVRHVRLFGKCSKQVVRGSGLEIDRKGDLRSWLMKLASLFLTKNTWFSFWRCPQVSSSLKSFNNSGDFFRSSRRAMKLR